MLPLEHSHVRLFVVCICFCPVICSTFAHIRTSWLAQLQPYTSVYAYIDTWHLGLCQGMDVDSKIPIMERGFDSSATVAGKNEFGTNVTVAFCDIMGNKPKLMNEFDLLWLFRSVLLGLSQKDCQVLSLDLNLRSNAFGSAGADVLQSFIPNISCITTLDISDNGDHILQCLPCFEWF